MPKLRSFCWSLLGHIGIVSFVAMALSPAAVGAPLVQITRPQHGETVYGQTSIDVAYRSDSDNPVEVLQLYVDNRRVREVVLAVPRIEGVQTFSWDFSFAVGTSHTIRAAAIDTKGNEGRAEIIVRLQSITTEQPDQIPPVVNIYYPAQGAEVSGEIELKANATDNVGVNAVFFYVDGKLHTMIMNAPPFVTKWDTTRGTDGPHLLRASAWDEADNQANSAEVTVIVNNRARTSVQLAASTPAVTPGPTPDDAPAVVSPSAARVPEPAATESVVQQTFGSPETAGGSAAAAATQADEVKVAALPYSRYEPGRSRTSQPARTVVASPPAAQLAAVTPAPASPKPGLVRLSSALTAKEAVAGGESPVVSKSVPARYAMAAASRNTMPATVSAAPIAPPAVTQSGAGELPAGPSGAATPMPPAWRAESAGRVTTPGRAAQELGLAPAVAARTAWATTEGAEPMIAAESLACRYAMTVGARNTMPASAAIAWEAPAFAGLVAPAQAGEAIEYQVAMLPRAMGADLAHPGRVGKPATDLYLPAEVEALRDIAVVFDGELLDLRAAPEVKAEISIGPLREIFEQTDGTLYWFPVKKQVRAVNKDVDIHLQIGDPVVTVNDQAQELVLAPYIKCGRTMVPLQFLADTLDVAIRYNPATGQLVISSNQF